MDVIEIDGASNTSVDNIRQIKDEILFPPALSRYKIYIIDEVHMLSNSAFNALLKTIEEPPPYIVFIFATTELHKVPATIKSRCQHFAFRLFSVEIIVELLESAVLELGVKADKEALLWIAKEAGGSMRDAYTLFDQVLSFSDGHISKAKLKEKLGLVGSDRMAEILGHCIAGRRSDALVYMDKILENGVSIEQFISDAASYVRSLLFIKSGIEKDSLLCYPRSDFPEHIISALDTEKLEYMLSVFFELHRSLRYCINPRWELELSISRLCFIKDYISTSKLAESISIVKKAIKEGAAGSNIDIASGYDNSFDEEMPGSSEANITETDHAIVDNAKANIAKANFAKANIAESTLANDELLNAAQLKNKIIESVGKNRVVLAACLERSGEWSFEGDKLVIPCQNSYDAGAVLADSAMLAKKLVDLSGRALRVEPITMLSTVKKDSLDNYDSSIDDKDHYTNDQVEPDPVKIVEKVFKGKRIE